ncbi:ATP-binding protein [Ancylobacter oerskovii]|uniref:ATP-binding protein n=1 Tax=Ancylobacter oerskovii TaxID=459519 RepID=A0ABW4Z1D2_9HYPH|nr:winged helix-turn-helix domain-containing protein [Ancylobacter oerskovii]MBS7542835.1 winged helix-turn-helix domain-containing protein [Ancylobacter oerskovii]
MLEDGTSDRVLTFGPFKLSVAKRLLEKNGSPVRLGARAFDILVALIERPGEVVSKQELVSRAWPNITVEEVALRVHIASLRKVLQDGKDGARYIINVPTRGYSFVGVADAERPTESIDQRQGGRENWGHLPRPLARMVGRDNAVRAVSEHLTRHRFVTILGTGGLGKTTVALAVVQEQIDRFGGAVLFLDLSAYEDSSSLINGLASRLGLMVDADDMLATVIRSLTERRILLVLDSCEPLVDSVAALAERIFQEGPQVSILATSREPLRVEGEYIFRLSPLDCPPDRPDVEPIAALGYPAVRLFVERAIASGYAAGNEADALAIGSICRRLDGLPLAIELAAGGVGIHGITATASLLGDRLPLIWPGRRTGQQRHQTLGSLIDWSYQLLDDAERRVFIRLSPFVGPFSLEAAMAVVSDDLLDESLVGRAVGSLVSKSLVSTAPGPTARYRLLDTTRAYAVDRLGRGADRDDVCRRHARFFLSHLSSLRPGAPGLDEFSEALDNVRAALTWSIDRPEDAHLFVRLAAQASSFLLASSRLSECERWCRVALHKLEEGMLGSDVELKLQGALGLSSMFVEGHGEHAHAALSRAAELAAGQKQPRVHLRAIAQLLMYHIRTGAFREMLALAQQAESLSNMSGNSDMLPAAHWMTGISHHFIGHQAAARVHLERALQPQPSVSQGATDIGFDYAERARNALAQVLWLQGFPDQALAVAMQSVSSASKKSEPITHCISLLWTTFIFLWTGDIANASSCRNQLSDLANRYSLKPYEAVIQGITGEILARQGGGDAGIRLLQSSVTSLLADRYELFVPMLSCALAEALLACGDVDGAKATVDRALARISQGGGSLSWPELLRLKALAVEASDNEAAEREYGRAIALAEEQTALSWGLRCATSLARLLVRQGRRDHARETLDAIYGRFREGFDTGDLKSARQLLNDLAKPRNLRLL